MAFKLDKTAFSKRPVEEQGYHRTYWLSKTPAERLSAAYMLSLRAYGIDPNSNPRMDKTYFRIKKR